MIRLLDSVQNDAVTVIHSVAQRGMVLLQSQVGIGLHSFEISKDASVDELLLLTAFLKSSSLEMYQYAFVYSKPYKINE